MTNTTQNKYIKYLLDDKGTGHVFERKHLLVTEQTKYQKLEISDLDILGRVLVLDNIIQLSELDCDRYHETFAHIPMSQIGEPKRALILGGGDGVLAHELLKYDNLIIDMVDIDDRVIELSKMYLRGMHKGSFENDRLNLYVQDALKFCESSSEKYDVIYGDITDPHPDSPSQSLLSDDTLKLYKSLLKDGGVIAIQTDNIQIAPQHSLNIESRLQKHFENVGNFGIVALTLSSLFSFVWASDAVLETREIKPAIKTNWLTNERVKLCMKILNLA